MLNVDTRFDCAVSHKVWSSVLGSVLLLNIIILHIIVFLLNIIILNIIIFPPSHDHPQHHHPPPHLPQHHPPPPHLPDLIAWIFRTYPHRFHNLLFLIWLGDTWGGFWLGWQNVIPDIPVPRPVSRPVPRPKTFPESWFWYYIHIPYVSDSVTAGQGVISMWLISNFVCESLPLSCKCAIGILVFFRMATL